MTEAIQGQLGKVERLVKEAHEFLGWKHEFFYTVMVLLYKKQGLSDRCTVSI